MSENWYVVGFENRGLMVHKMFHLFFVEENIKTTSKSIMNYILDTNKL